MPFWSLNQAIVFQPNPLNRRRTSIFCGISTKDVTKYKLLTNIACTQTMPPVLSLFTYHDEALQTCRLTLLHMARFITRDTVMATDDFCWQILPVPVLKQRFLTKRIYFLWCSGPITHSYLCSCSIRPWVYFAFMILHWEMMTFVTCFLLPVTCFTTHDDFCSVLWSTYHSCQWSYTSTQHIYHNISSSQYSGCWRLPIMVWHPTCFLPRASLMTIHTDSWCHLCTLAHLPFRNRNCLTSLASLMASHTDSRWRFWTLAHLSFLTPQCFLSNALLKTIHADSSWYRVYTRI